MLWIGMTIGFVAGLGLAYILKMYRHQTAKELAAEMFRESEAHLQNSFGKLSLDALSKNSTEFLKLAKEKLESQSDAHTAELDKKKELIEKDNSQIAKVLEDVVKLVEKFEKDREQKFGALEEQLKNNNQNTVNLAKTTQGLSEMLANNKARGDLGEKIAEEILKFAGLLEGIHYLKQKTLESVGSRPDFTFLLPKNMKLNMDVKFPLNNYRRYVQTQNESEKQGLLAGFFKDIKTHIKEVTTRDYIGTDQNTADYVLLFIPNEGTFAFIQEKNPDLLEEALRSKVICCSPMTLFAVLATIRQAAENFALEQTSNEILSLLGAFKKQWEEYVKKMDGLGSKLVAAQKEFDDLTSTRKKKLESPLNKIDALRQQKGLPILEPEETTPLLPELVEEKTDLF